MTEAGEEDSVAALVRTKDAPTSLPQVVHFNAANAAISVGRAETNQIIINDKKISKVHAKLTLRTCKRKGASDAEAMKRLFVKDSSTFGTFINGKAIPKEQWQILQEGDVLGLRNPHGNASLGEYRVQYNEGEAGGVAPTPTAAGPAATTRRAKPGPTQPLGQVAPGSPLSEEGDQVEALSPLSEVSDAPPPGAAPVPAPAPPSLLHGTMPGLIPGLSGLLPGMVPGLPPGLPPGLAPGMNMHGPCGIRLPFPGVFQVPGLPFGVPLLHGAPGLQHLLPQGMVPTGPVPNAALPGSTAKAGGPLLAGQVPPGAVATAPVTMTVQAEFIGMLIGRGGEVVKQFSKDSGARIEISKTPGEKETGERSIFLSGTHEAIEKAKKMIEDTINKAKETRGGTAAPNACTLKVPHDVIGMLIGRGGETIKELKKESGAKIDINKEKPEDTDRIVSISGPPECVEHAKKMIDEMLEKSRDRYSSITVKAMEVSKDAVAIPTPTALVGPADKVTILIPTELIGMLIGKGGETIRTIQKDCGVQMEIMKGDGSNDSKRAVQVTGPTESCARARIQIEEVLGRAREVPADPRKERESRKDSSYTFDLAAELVGRLIGRGGDTISRIQRETGAKVDVAREARDGEHAITVKGDPEAVEKAREMIEDVLGQRKKHRRRDRERARDDDNDEGMHQSTKDERPRSPPLSTSKARGAYSKGDGKGWPEFPWPPPPDHTRGMPPPGIRPPFDYGPPPGYGPLPPPFDPRGPPPPFDYRPPPPYGRLPPPPGWFDYPPPPYDRRPPFDGPPPPHGERPPFEPGPAPVEPGPPPSEPPGGAEGEHKHRRRRRRHHREGEEGEGRKRRRGVKTEESNAEQQPSEQT